MFAYAEDLELTDKMSRLAREELRHYEQVAKLIRKLEVAPLRLAPAATPNGCALGAKAEPLREVDLMICGASSKRGRASVLRHWRRRSAHP
jgi:tRNA-(ms[2]io[6]A)-hydroxylase